MNNILYILLHSGLGDHIICNAVIRHYARKHDKIIINVTAQTAENVKYMYRDLDNISFIELYYTSVLEFIKTHKGNNYLVLGCTADYFNKLSSHAYPTFDYGFYVMARIPHEKRWDDFYFLRDIDKEMDIFYNRLGLKDGEEYIFIHEDPSRNRLLDRNLLPAGIRQIKADDYKDVSIFNLPYTIKKAKEVHVMDSCFLALIDNMMISHDKLFLHNYKENRVATPTAVKLNWIKYNKK